MGSKNEILSNLKLELRKGTLVLAVLSQLKEKHYGYSLVEELNNKKLKIDQNTLYPLLRRLEKQELLTSNWDVNETRPRKYYSLSKLGSEVLTELINEWNNSNQVISSLIREGK
ncbi:PadR family transcriptional regulator [Mycoplasmatota bacterium WC44]